MGNAVSWSLCRAGCCPVFTLDRAPGGTARATIAEPASPDGGRAAVQIQLDEEALLELAEILDRAGLVDEARRRGPRAH